MFRPIPTLCWTALAVALGPGLLLAQDDAEAEELEAFIGEDIPIEENILPTARPFGSVFGLDQNILDVPRNVTIISREQLDAIAIEDVRDFTKLTTSSYTRTNFGAPSNPDIRTQIADVMYNGIRKGLTSNGNGLPVNFNAVESVNIVKGPATVIHGPSFYVGGYADLVTKRPFFDAFRGEVFATYGSYETRRWGVDVGGPISDTLAFRVSYSGEDSDSFYENSFIHSQAVYAAVTFRPSENYELFANFEYFYANYTENFGINRVTQDLIDNGLYITGVNVNPAPAGFIGTLPEADPQNSAFVRSGFPLLNLMDLDTENPVELDRSKVLRKPGDDSEGYSVAAQVIQTFRVSEAFQIVNNTFFHTIDRETLSSYRYFETMESSRFENRLEARWSTEALQINAGFAINYQDVEAYNDFFFEPANVWDLTQDPNFIDVTNSLYYQESEGNPFFGRFLVPGYTDQYASPGVFNGDTNDSQVWQSGAFAQVVYKPVEQVTLLAGGRVDYLDVHTEDPLADDVNAAFEGIGSDLRITFEDEISVTILNYNLGVNLRATDFLAFYAAYNFSENPGGAVANGGGFGQWDTDPDSATGFDFVLTESRYKQESELYELGTKLSVFDDRLYVGASVFQQERSNLNQDGSIDEFETRGFEIEANYQPNANFFMTLSYSYLDAKVNGVSFYVINTGVDTDSDGEAEILGGFYEGQTPFFLLPDGEYRRQGVPYNVVNGLVSYAFDFGLTLQAAAIYTSEINNNVAGTLVIPDQYNIDLTAIYAYKSWEARLTVLNVTDEENWAPPNAVYAEESILAEEPIRAEFTLSYSF